MVAYMRNYNFKFEMHGEVYALFMPLPELIINYTHSTTEYICHGKALIGIPLFQIIKEDKIML